MITETERFPFRQKAMTIARCMGAVLAPLRDSGYPRWGDVWAEVEIAGLPGALVILHFDERKKRIEVSGRWPVSKHAKRVFEGRVESITVDATRSSPDIAKDIHRRFLNKYRAEFAERAKWAAEADAHSEREHAAARRLYELLDQQWPAGMTSINYVSLGQFAVSFQVGGGRDTDQQVSLTIENLAPEQAEKVLTHLKDSLTT